MDGVVITHYESEDYQVLKTLLERIDDGTYKVIEKVEYDTETGLPAKKFNAMDVEDMQENVVND